MRVAVIGRTEILYQLINDLLYLGHEVTCIITAKEAPEYNKTKKDFEELAIKYEIPFSDEIPIVKNFSVIEKSKSDIAISINYPGIIPQSIIELFEYGILNAHAGDLPRYKGNACQSWAILNGEKKIGLCIHKMIGDKLDAGDIIARMYYPITINTKITEILDWISKTTPQLIIKSLNILKDNSDFVLQTQHENDDSSLRCFPLKPSDGKINWNSTSDDILKKINAFNKPFQGAYSFLNEKKIIIWDAQLTEYKFNFCAIPGQVICIEKGFIKVACLNSIIRINKVEYDNSLGSPDQFIKSIRNRLENS